MKKKRVDLLQGSLLLLLASLVCSGASQAETLATGETTLGATLGGFTLAARPVLRRASQPLAQALPMAAKPHASSQLVPSQLKQALNAPCALLVTVPQPVKPSLEAVETIKPAFTAPLKHTFEPSKVTFKNVQEKTITPTPQEPKLAYQSGLAFAAVPKNLVKAPKNLEQAPKNLEKAPEKTPEKTPEKKVLFQKLLQEGATSAVGSKSTTPQLGLIPAVVPSSNTEDTFHTALQQPVGYSPADITLSLPEVVNLSLQHSLGLLIAGVQAKQALAFKKEAYADFLPNLLLSFRYSYFDGGIQIFTGEPVRAKIATILPEARLNLPINVAGAALHKLKARDKNHLLKLFAEQVVTQETLMEVSETYINLLNRYLDVSLIEQAEKEAEAQLALSQARFDEGLGILLEVLESKNQVQLQEQRSLEAKQALKEANYKLNTYLGFMPDVALVPTLNSITELSLYKSDETLEPLLAYALAHEPSVQQGQAKAESKHALYKQAIAEAFPTLNLNAYINGVGKKVDNLQTTRYSGLELTFNALEGLGVKPYQKIQQAKLDWQESQLALEQQQRKVREQVASAFIAFQTSEKRVEVSKERLLTSEKSREQANGRYEAGLGNYLEVVTASTSLQQARNQYVSTLLAYKKNQLTLARQTGELKQRLLALLPIAETSNTNAVSTAPDVFAP